LIGLARDILSNSLSLAQPESLTQSIHSTLTLGNGISGVPNEATVFLLFLGIPSYISKILFCIGMVKKSKKDKK